MSTEKFSFGNETCNPHIEVDVFEPVCAHDEIPGSEPLTLEVPVPTFVPIVPPPECTCFTFQQSDSISRVSMTMRKRSTITDKSPLKNTAKTTIEARGDCCDGTYDIGTWITLEVPECLHADGLVDSKTYNFNDDAASGISGSITVETWMKDCVPVLKVSGEPLRVHIDPPIISIPPLCINPADITVKPVYYTRDADGELILNTQDENYGGTTVNMSVTDGEGGCKQLSFSNGDDGAVTLDLTGISTFGNGGSVAQLGDHNLYIDGAVDEDLPGYYGGGYGDWKVASTNIDYDMPFSRGPLMRYTKGDADPSPVLSGSVNQYAVPVEAVDTYFAVAAETNGSTTWGQSKYWQSARRSACNAQDAGKNCRTVAGPLDVIWPTGIQWGTNGLSLALPLTEFLFNESGILSEAQETGAAALVSPGPATTLAYGSGTSALLKGKNASGLVSRAKDNTEAARISDGLRVNAGAGLRIYGLLDGRVASDDAGGGSHTATGYNPARQGQLEVMYGPGFRIRAANSGTTPQYRDKPVDEDGALVPNEGRGLRVHGVTKMGGDSTDAAHKNKLEVFGHSGDFKFNHDGKMVINDEKSDTDVVLPKLTSLSSQCRATEGDKFTRNGDRTLRLCLIQPKRGADTDKYWGSGCEGDWIKQPIFPSVDQSSGSGGFTFRAAGSVRDRLVKFIQAINGNATWSEVAEICRISHSAGPNFSVGPETDDAASQEQLEVLAWEIGALAQAVLDIQSWLANCLTYAYVHIGKAGTVLAINGDSGAPAATDRHYQANAPTP